MTDVGLQEIEDALKSFNRFIDNDQLIAARRILLSLAVLLEREQDLKDPGSFRGRKITGESF